MRLIDADKLYPDRFTRSGTLAISQSQIAEAPTVERPQNEWIPLKTKLPAKDGTYLITKLVLGKPYITTASFIMDLYSVDKYAFYKYRYKRKTNRWGWYDYDSEYGFYEINRQYIIAWMPLPEPYKEEEND